MASPDSSTKLRIAVAPVDTFVPGKPIMIQAGRHGIGVYRIGDEFRAILDFCPHEGVHICKGTVEGAYSSQGAGTFCHERHGEILACPWHGWQFDLHTGESLHDPRCRLKTYPVEVEDGMVYVLT